MTADKTPTPPDLMANVGTDKPMAWNLPTQSSPTIVRDALATPPAARIQEAARAREWLTPPPSWRRLAKAAIDLLWAIDEKHDSQKPPLKYSVPYGAVNGLRIALCAAEDPAAPTTNEINDLPANIEDSPAAIAHTQQPAAAQAKSEAVVTIRRGGTAVFGRACLVERWEAGSERLADGLHALYTAPQQEAERQPLSEAQALAMNPYINDPVSQALWLSAVHMTELRHGITGPATQETKHG